jgi:hypothetical protein
MVQEWRRSDVDQVDVWPLHQGFDFLEFVNPKPLHGGLRSLPVRSCHAGELYAGYLRKVLQRKEPEPATADNAEPDRFFAH